MEKITDKIAALPNHANYFSLEFFPPKTDMVGVVHLAVRVAFDNACRALPIFKPV